MPPLRRRRAPKPAAAANPDRPATSDEGSGTQFGVGGGTTITGGGFTGGTTTGGGLNGGGGTGGTTITGGTGVGGTATETGGDTGQSGGNRAEAWELVNVNVAAVNVAVGNTFIQRQRAAMAHSLESNLGVQPRQEGFAWRDCAGSAFTSALQTPLLQQIAPVPELVPVARGVRFEPPLPIERE